MSGRLNKSDIKFLVVMGIVLILAICVAVFVLIPSVVHKKPESMKLTTIEYDGDMYHYVTYVDEAGIPTLDPNRGYVTIRRLLDINGNNIEEYYLDVDGDIVELSGGYSGVQRTYTYFLQSDRYLCTRYSYIDSMKNIVEITAGYASVDQFYDENNRVIKQLYLDVDGNPVASTEGAYGSLREYDNEGRQTWITYIDQDGEISATNRGYTMVHYEYDSEGRVEYSWYCNSNREAMNIGRGQYGFHIVRDENGAAEYVSVDKDGKEVVNLDEVIKEHPIVVIIGVILSAELAVCLGRKLRIGLFCGSILAIFYMTLLSREPGFGNRNIDIFTSYMHFFSDDIARSEVIYNVLLFIPFGVLLRSLITQKQNKFGALLNPTNLCILCAFLLSLFIEMVQLVFKLGTFQLDDLVDNTLGGILGVAIYYVIKRRNNIFGRLFGIVSESEVSEI